jgi:membrane-associated phospholipid phosphatase
MRLWHADIGGAADAPTAALKKVVQISRPRRRMFWEQLDFVAGYADLRADRTAEILAQMNGGMAFLASISYLHPDRTPRTIELLLAALRLATHVEMRFKHALACRRPHEYSAQIQPMILTPTHGSYPSGHGTEAFISALVLWALLREAGIDPYQTELEWGTQLMRQAARIAINRTIAGVHFPVDSAAGALLGLTLGNYFVSRCKGGNFQPWRFEGTKFPRVIPSTPNPPPDADFYWKFLFDEAAGTQFETRYARPSDAAYAIAANPVLNWLWERAKEEWQ